MNPYLSKTKRQKHAKTTGTPAGILDVWRRGPDNLAVQFHFLVSHAGPEKTEAAAQRMLRYLVDRLGRAAVTVRYQADEYKIVCRRTEGPLSDAQVALLCQALREARVTADVDMA